MVKKTPSLATSPSGMEDVARRRRNGLVWGGAVLLVVLLAPLAPWLASGLWACPLKELSGVPCPSCGTTRAALHLARLEVVEALVHYPLPTLGWMVFILGGTVAGVAALLHRPLPSIARPPTAFWWFLGAAVLANWGYSIATGV